VAGPQTVDAVREIKASHSNCVVIGVDTPQENDPTTNDKSSYTDVNNNNDIIKFSATKNIADLTSKILSLSMAQQATDHPDNPNVGTYGYLTVGNTTNRGIMPSENS
jgi:basic membrane lipoprotein Med (substrate-binding protein (PBP1-ABC) superfamily)